MVNIASALFVIAVVGAPGQLLALDECMAGLLHRDDVQTEIKMRSDQLRKWAEIDRQPKVKQGGSFEDDPLDLPDPKAVEARDAEREKKVWSLLSPDQSLRLRQLLIQRIGLKALIRPDVQAELELSDDQKEKVTRSHSAFVFARTELNTKVKSQKTEIGRLDPKKIKDRLQSIDEKYSSELDGILSDGQRLKLKELGGRPFVFSKSR